MQLPMKLPQWRMLKCIGAMVALIVVLLISVVEQSFVVPQCSRALAVRVVLVVPAVALMCGSFPCLLFGGVALRGPYDGLNWMSPP